VKQRSWLSKWMQWRVDNKKMHEVCTKEKEIKNSKMERMQRKVNINCCEKCTLKERKTRTPKWENAMKSWQHLLQEVCREKKECKNRKLKTMQWEANINYCKNCALKRKNVGTTNWKQCNEHMTIAIARNAHQKEKGKNITSINSYG